jgi:hypothetical protein
MSYHQKSVGRMSHIYDKKKEQCSCGWKSRPNSLVHWEQQWVEHLQFIKQKKLSEADALISLLKLVLLYTTENILEGMTPRELLLSFTDYCIYRTREEDLEA